MIVELCCDYLSVQCILLYVKKLGKIKKNWEKLRQKIEKEKSTIKLSIETPILFHTLSIMPWRGAYYI